MKLQLRYIDLVSVVALVLAGLSLVLVVLLLSNSLNQPASQNQQSLSEQNVQALQGHIDSLTNIQTQVNNSLWSLEMRWNKTSKEITARYQLQNDNLVRELETVKFHQNTSYQKIDALRIQQTNLSQGIETCRHEVQLATENLNIKLSTLQENVSFNVNELSKLADSIQTINHTINNQGPTIDSCSQRGTLSHPARSCNDICQDSPSGLYWIQVNSFFSPAQVYCDMSPRNCSCDATGGWMRAAYIDMNEPSQQCPSRFKLITRSRSPRRTCGRPDSLSEGCVSTMFPVHGVQYSHVCGRIVGYQIGTPSGFRFGESTIDGHYLAGISLTHGRVRQHIWSFVNAKGEGYTTEVCPCISGSQDNPPSFIDNDFFCDTAVSRSIETPVDGQFYPDNPLWDGQGCGSASTCCEFNSPPWFCKQLTQSTTDDIELRICENSGPDDDDSPFEIVELYIK